VDEVVDVSVERDFAVDFSPGSFSLEEENHGKRNIKEKQTPND
jgi:hypothetical protein